MGMGGTCFDLQESICLLWSQNLFSRLLNLISWTRDAYKLWIQEVVHLLSFSCIPEIKRGEMQLKILELKIAYSNPITESWGTSTSNVIVNLEFQSDCNFQFFAHTHTHTLSLSLSLSLSLIAILGSFTNARDFWDVTKHREQKKIYHASNVAHAKDMQSARSFLTHACLSETLTFMNYVLFACPTQENT
jgi:hypothetical protein